MLGRLPPLIPRPRLKPELHRGDRSALGSLMKERLSDLGIGLGSGGLKLTSEILLQRDVGYIQHRADLVDRRAASRHFSDHFPPLIGRDKRGIAPKFIAHR